MLGLKRANALLAGRLTSARKVLNVASHIWISYGGFLDVQGAALRRGFAGTASGDFRVLASFPRLLDSLASAGLLALVLALGLPCRWCSLQ